MATNLNTDFLIDLEVGDSLSSEDASPHSLAVPQFSYEGGCEASVEHEPQGSWDVFKGEEVSVSASKDSSELAPLRPSPNPWPPKLVIDLALGLDHLDDILAAHGLTRPQYDRLTEIPTFRRELASTMRDLRENGVPFARKAAIQAESYLVNLDEMVHDLDVPASTRLEAIKSVVKWGKLEPKEDKGQDSGGNTINLQINFT